MSEGLAVVLMLAGYFALGLGPLAGAAIKRAIQPHRTRRRLRKALLAPPVPIKDLANRKTERPVVVSGEVRPAGRSHRTPFGDVEVIGYRVTVTAFRGRQRAVIIDRAVFEPFFVEDGSGVSAVVRPGQAENLMFGSRYRLVLQPDPVVHATFDDLAARTDLREIDQQLHHLPKYERFECLECALREGDTATVCGGAAAAAAAPGMGYRDGGWQVEITDPEEGELVICNRSQQWLRNEKEILLDEHRIPRAASYHY